MDEIASKSFGDSLRRIVRWFDGHAEVAPPVAGQPKRIDRFRLIPFLGMHLGCLAVCWVGYSHIALAIAIGLYLIRMFAITGFYHRYFSHRTFKTSRWFQFVMAFVGCSCAQRGPMWWAGHHRHHHNHSDEEVDLHSPGQDGFLWSHMLWFLTKSGSATTMKNVRDWQKFPEIVFLDRFDWIAPGVLGLGLWGLGAWLGHHFPSLHTSGAQMFVYGFFISTVVVYHATYTINSLAHQYGSQRFNTGDDSRNNIWLALLTLGEGWHNNHHFYPASLRQGFYWWEIDITFYILWTMKQVGLVWDLRPVPLAELEHKRLAGTPAEKSLS
jgi:stearoyl-CoA desaturase (delta-9 desaturase)